MTRGIFYVLLGLAMACDPSQDPVKGLRVDFGASGEGDGSECSPFRTLDAALVTAASAPLASLILSPSAAEGEVAAGVLVTHSLSIEGGRSIVTIRATISVSGRLSIANVVLKSASGRSEELFACLNGVVVMQGIEVGAGSRTFLKLSSGSVTITSSQFTGLTGAVLDLRTTSSLVALNDVSVEGCSLLIEINSSEGENGGSIALTHSTLRGSGQIILWKGAGAMDISVEDCDIDSATAVLLQGNVQHAILTWKDVSVRDSPQVLSAAVTDSELSFLDSDFARIDSTLFDLSALSGELRVLNCSIVAVAQGPVILLPSNSFPPSLALVTVEDSLIANVTNFAGSGLGIVLVGMLVTFRMQDTEVRLSNVVEGGLFSVTAGSVQLSNVNYHDCSVVVFSFYESIATTATLRNVSMTRTSSDIVAFTMCIAGSTCLWDQVAITHSTDPNVPRSRSFVLLWSGIGALATVRNSYFHNVGRSEPCMAVTEAGVIHLYDSVFVELDNNDAFDSIQDGFILFDNVTFVSPQLNILFWCGMTKTCFQLSRIKIVGNYSVPIFLFADGGESSVSDSTFEGIFDSVFRVMNGNLVVTNVTLKHQNGFVCRGCIGSTISFSQFQLSHSESDMFFQFSYSSVTFLNSSISTVTCEELFELDQSRLTIARSTFDSVKVDSFGGLVTAESSVIEWRDCHSEMLRSALSIKIGLIYTVNSVVSLQRSHFHDFNATLIYAVQSEVSLLSTEFTKGGLFGAVGTKAVVSYGSVVWGELSNVRAVDCLFQWLSADEGGVMYLTGGGTETCEIGDCEVWDNWARKRGGVVYASSVRVKISGSELSRNSAEQGGVLYTRGTGGELLATLTNSVFHHNSATRDGGTLMHVRSQYSASYCDFLNNTAEYGPDFASELSRVLVLDDQSCPSSNYTIEAVSGQLFDTPISIACLDELGQVIATDNSSKLTLFTVEANTSLVGTTLLNAKKGLFSLDSVTIIGTPVSTVTVYGTLGTNLTQALFTARLRDCVMGEYLDEGQCTPCTHNTYSFSPTTACRLCPPAADCPAGYRMVLHSGYWRASQVTDSIFQCLIPETCLGGLESECSEGHSGVMCSHCTDNHYKGSQLQCVTCENKGVSAVKGILTVSIAILSVVYAETHYKISFMTHLVMFDYLHTLRILANYNIFWPQSIVYLYNVAGDIGSIGLSAFTDPCLGVITGISTVYSQLIVSLLYPVLLCTVAAMIYRTFKFFITAVKFGGELRLVAYLAYLMLPMVFLRVLEMFPCYGVGSDQFLVYDSSVQCWTRKHTVYTLCVSLPVFVLAASVPFVLLLGALRNTCRMLTRMPRWQYFCLYVFLVRKYTLICILLFSNALTLPTQVSFVIMFNLAAEISLHSRPECQHLFFYGFYHSTLVSSTLLSFTCAIYWASTTRVTEKETPFILVNYACLLYPVAYCVMFVVYRRMKKDMRYVVPVERASVDARQETVNPRSVVIDENQEASGAYLNAPHSTPLSH